MMFYWFRNGSVTQSVLKRCMEMFVEKTNIVLDGLISEREFRNGKQPCCCESWLKCGLRGEPANVAGQEWTHSSKPLSQNLPKDRAISVELGYWNRYVFLVTWALWLYYWHLALAGVAQWIDQNWGLFLCFTGRTTAGPKGNIILMLKKKSLVDY